MKALRVFYLYVAQTLGQKYTVISTVSGTAPTSKSINVSCTFSNQWTAERHPNSYPTNNTGWSPMILASHNGNYTMWATRELASSAVQIVAETGVKSPLLAELENSSNVLAQEDGRALYLSKTESFELEAFLVNADFPLISSITKIVPSPDWFSGFTDFSPMNSSTDTWYESFEIDTLPFDAGTDSRPLCGSIETPTVPPENISQKRVGTLPADGVFVSSDGTTVLAVAKWICTVADVRAPATISPSPTVAPSANGTVATPTADPSDNVFADSPSIAPSGTASADTGAPSAEAAPKSSEAPTGLIDATVVPYVGSPSTASPTAQPSLGAGGGTVGPTMNVTPYDVIQTVPSSTESNQAVGYSCSITNSWTATNHPKDYPTDAALWSPMVLTTHSVDYQMWGNGMVASTGVKSLAKSGSPSLLLAELDIQEDGVILDQKTGSVLTIAKNTTNEQTLQTARLDVEHPYITTISKIAPSPDWFSDFYNFSAVDSATSTWYESFIIQTYPWDAGTDSGTTYNADDVPTDPPVEIFQLTVDTIPESEVFISENTSSGKTVPPVSKWVCTQVEAPPPPETSGTVLASILIAFTTFLTTTLFVS